MRGEKKRGCGCGWLALLAIAGMLVAGGGFLVFNKYYVIMPRDTLPDAAALKATPTPAPRVVQAPTPDPALVGVDATPTPPPTVDLVDLETKMQDWPEEVTIESAATFPGEVVAPAGTSVKVVSAGPEVEVEYQGENARLLADQTDLVARVLTHRAQVAREMEYERRKLAAASELEQRQSDAKMRQIEAVYGKQPAHEDAYFAIKTYLKQIQKDPDAVQMTSVSDLFPAEYGGQKCWAAKVRFRLRDAMGFYQEQGGTAYVADDKAIGYENFQQ